MSERKKYNWRTHDWKVGDRCLIKETADGFDRFIGVVKRAYSDFENAMIIEDPETQDTYVIHRAECIPLRKKEGPRLREFWINGYHGHEPGFVHYSAESAAAAVQKGFKETGPHEYETVHVREVRPVREKKERVK